MPVGMKVNKRSQGNDHSLVDNIDVSFIRNTVDKARYDMIFNAGVVDRKGRPVEENKLTECLQLLVGARDCRSCCIAQRNLPC